MAITDPRGRWLAIDKWNRLAPRSTATPLESRTECLLPRRWSLSSWETGDTRSTSWAEPCSARCGPAICCCTTATSTSLSVSEVGSQDVILVSFELERQLVSLGYTVVRHSHAHLEIVFFTNDGGTDYYIDIFTGYYSADGLYNQPFALRGKLAKTELLPTIDLDVGGVTLPAPAVPEAWLEFAYGPNWRIPDPSFHGFPPTQLSVASKAATGCSTGNGCSGRRPGKRSISEHQMRKANSRMSIAFSSCSPSAPSSSTLGVGTDGMRSGLPLQGHNVLGVDYSFEALRVARQTQPENVEYRFLNFNDRHGLLLFALEMITRPSAVLLCAQLTACDAATRVGPFRNAAVPAQCSDLPLCDVRRHAGPANPAQPTDVEYPPCAFQRGGLALEARHDLPGRATTNDTIRQASECHCACLAVTDLLISSFLDQRISMKQLANIAQRLAPRTVTNLRKLNTLDPQLEWCASADQLRTRAQDAAPRG